MMGTSGSLGGVGGGLAGAGLGITGGGGGGLVEEEVAGELRGVISGVGGELTFSISLLCFGCEGEEVLEEGEEAGESTIFVAPFVWGVLFFFVFSCAGDP